MVVQSRYKSILKFGGTSVGSAQALQALLAIVQERYQKKETSPVAVVVSAVGGVTNDLIKLANTAALGGKDWTGLYATIQNRHTTLCQELKLEGSALSTKIQSLFDELKEIVTGISAVREVSLKTQDLVMSFGERISIEIVAALLQSFEPHAHAIDTRSIIKTNSAFGNAQVDLDETHKKIAFKDFGTLPVFSGFIASNPQDITTTLGRGGSDYTAALLGRALAVNEIEIWTDVDGVLTADPRKVKSAFPLPTLSYEEAMELSHFGAKVIYPPTIQPALSAGIPVLIKNTFNPTATGTRVEKASATDLRKLSGIASLSAVALLNIEGSGMQGVAGIAARIFSCLAREKISVILITQASSEHTICFAIAPEQSDDAYAALTQELALEIKNEQIQPLVVEKDLAIIAAVGDGMRHMPGVAGKMFSALGRNGINIRAIAQGGSERNISAVIASKDENTALEVLHDSLFLRGIKKVHVYIIGPGLIGKELVNIVEKQREKILQQRGISLIIAGLSDSKKFLVDAEGVSLSALSSGTTVTADENLIQRMCSVRTSNSIFVDCSASDQLPMQYENILGNSISIVTPNKRANAGALSLYKTLQEAAAKANVKYLYETTVGAGLPVLSTLQDLLASGDEIIKIDAVLSGTLSYIWNELKPGIAFSKLVAAAKEKGLTEPDPRDDLSGQDVARKVLILAREAGFALEQNAITLRPLISPEIAAAPSAAAAMDALQTMDKGYAKQLQQASDKNRRLCYLASISKESATISLQEIDSSSPFFGLSGTDNMISFTTERYKERPLVIKGPGAGKEVTAAGIFADIVRVASYAE